MLGVIEGRELSNILSPSQLAALDLSTLDTTQAHAVRQTYAHAFSHILRVSTILSGISIGVGLLSYQKNPATLAERAQQQIAAETARQIAKRRGPVGVSGPAHPPPAPKKSATSSESSGLS